MRAAALLALLVSGTAHAQALTPADMTLLGMQLGRNTLQDVLGHLGIAPLRHGDVDELCYRSENPLQATWVLFGSGEAGDWEKLTRFRVVTIEPPGITCRPHASIASDVATPSGIRIGMPAEELATRIGHSLRITAEGGRVASFEVRLAE